MRILVLSALLVAATQAAPRIEGSLLRPRDDLYFEDQSIEPNDGAVDLGEGIGDENSSSREDLTDFFANPYSMGTSSTSFTDYDESDYDPEPNKGLQKVPNPNQERTAPTEQPTAPPRTAPPGTAPPGSAPPGSAPPGYAPGGENPSDGNPSQGAPGQKYPQAPPSDQTPTASDPSVFQWFDGPPPQTGASGCWFAQNPNTGSRAEMCQLCLPTGCTDAERVNSTKGWRLCIRERGGRISVGPKTCIVAKKAPRN